MKYKIVIWGIGSTYNKHVNNIKFLESREEIEVVAVTANKMPPFRTVDGYPLVLISELGMFQYDYIIVMSDMHFSEIVWLAMKNGALRSQIIPYRILELPGINFKEYIKLKESNISIIANNCWGGLICRTLGIECLSPFKNLFFEDDDYIQLLQNMEYYLEKELTFVQYKEYIYTSQLYPVMKLDDILVHCLHYKNQEEAVSNWNRRRLKINYQNLFVEMYTEREDIMKKFLSLDRFQKKVCFVPFDSSGQALQLDLYPGQTWFWESLNTNATNEANSLSYNIIDLLNNKRAERFTRI